MTALLLTAALAVSSQVTDVTVYSDRAQVVRTAEVNLDPGLHTLRFEELPSGVDAQGIQVDGSGAATVMDVRFRTENLKEVAQEAWRELYAREEQLKEERRALEQRISAYGESRDFLLRISARVTAPKQREQEDILDRDKWEQMLDMVLEQQLDYDEAIRAAEEEMKAVDLKLEKVRGDIKATGARSSRERRVVEVDVDVSEAGPVALRLSYLVHGPAWVPAYDVRVDTQTRKMELKTFALIRQNSGEDWTDVKLKLSTAAPALGGQHATLQPWRLQVADSGAGGGGRGVQYGSAYNGFAGMDHRSMVNFAPAALSDKGVMADREAEVVEQGTAVVFVPEGISTIESDNVEHRIAVSGVTLPSHFRYSAVPKLDTHAYLKAKAVNSSGHPLPAGRANIYLDGSYVTTSELKAVPQGEAFWVFLGVDAGMTVEYRLVKHFRSDERRNTVRHTREFLIQIKNTHAEPEEVIVWDQLPISQHEEIEVKLLEPRYSGDTQELKIDEAKRLQWFRTLAPGEEWSIPFSFQMDVPAGMAIQGFE